MFFVLLKYAGLGGPVSRSYIILFSCIEARYGQFSRAARFSDDSKHASKMKGVELHRSEKKLITQFLLTAHHQANIKTNLAVAPSPASSDSECKPGRPQ